MLPKCQKYPDCDCFNNWVLPALELDDPLNADLFATAMKELDNYSGGAAHLSYDGLLAHLSRYFIVIPQSLKRLFADKIFALLQEDYLWKFPSKIDLHRLSVALAERGFKESALSDMQENNTQFIAQVNSYYKKIQTIAPFLNTDQFIAEELQRVEKDFIQPLRVTSDQPMRKVFDAFEYTGMAYRMLKQGHDWSIRELLNKALEDYRFHNDKAPENKEQYFQSIRAGAQRGVGFLMYQRFLKEAAGELNQAPPETISLEQLDQFLKKGEHDRLDQNLRAFQGMQNYIVKHVYQDTKAELGRLEQLVRNLQGWLGLLSAIFEQSILEQASFDDPTLHSRQSEAVHKIKNTISSALDLLTRRIEGKKLSNKENALQHVELVPSSNDDALQQMIATHLDFLRQKNPRNKRPIAEEKYIVQIIEETTLFLATGKRKKENQPIPKLNMTNDELSYTLRQLYHKHHPSGKISFEFYEFLNATFAQLTRPGFTRENFKTLGTYKKSATLPSFYNDLIKKR